MSRLSGIVVATLVLLAFAFAAGDVSAHGWAGHGWGGHGWHFGHFRRFGCFSRFGNFSCSGASGAFPGAFHGQAVPGYYGYYASPTFAPGCVWVRQLVPGPYGPVWRYYPACYYGY
jgi:hypothetical protein